MMKRSNYGEPSKLVKGRRVVKVLMGELDEANEAAAIVKSKAYSYFRRRFCLRKTLENLKVRRGSGPHLFLLHHLVKHDALHLNPSLMMVLLHEVVARRRLEEPLHEIIRRKN